MKNKIGKNTWIPGIGIGIGVSITMTVLGALVLAWLLSSGRTEEEQVGYATAVIWILSAMAGTLTAGAIAGERLLVVSLITGIGYFVVMILANLGFYGGEMEGILPALGTILGAGGASCLILSRPKKASRQYVRKKRTG